MGGACVDDEIPLLSSYLHLLGWTERGRCAPTFWEVLGRTCGIEGPECGVPIRSEDTVGWGV